MPKAFGNENTHLMSSRADYLLLFDYLPRAVVPISSWLAEVSIYLKTIETVITMNNVSYLPQHRSLVYTTGKNNHILNMELV